jgi:hypothetical protein
MPATAGSLGPILPVIVVPFAHRYHVASDVGTSVAA